MKRLFDLFFSSIGIILLGLPFLITAVLIKILMPGPVFFIQSRVGKRGVLFHLIKFRTMEVASGKNNASFDAGDRSRITAFGGFLRKIKFDELPQLFNVFIGNMSIVGPRPEVKQWTEFYPEKWRIVHSIKPGITDEASVLFRNEEILLASAPDPVEMYKKEILPKKLDIYVQYVRNRSFFGDMKIIIKTLYTVIFK